MQISTHSLRTKVPSLWEIRVVATCSYRLEQDIMLQLLNQPLHIIILQNDLWAGYVPSRSPNLFIYPCPSGYCRCFQNTSLGSTLCASTYSHSSPDLQCKCDRQGSYFNKTTKSTYTKLRLFAQDESYNDIQRLVHVPSKLATLISDIQL